MYSIIKVLKGFHHRVYWRIAGKKARSVGAEGWEWSPMEEALEAIGLWLMKEYARQFHYTIEEYISMRPIYDICTGV